MEGDLTWFKFRSRWIKTIKALSKPEIDRLFDVIDAYNNDRELPEMTGRESVAWTLIEPDLEDDKRARREAAEKNAVISESRSIAGKKGGRPKKTENQIKANESKQNQLLFEKSKQKQTKANESLRVKELRVKENKEVNNIAKTDVFAPEKPKLTPNDDDFWKFAKENEELAKTFYKATGISPVKSQFGRWVNDLRDLHEAGISAEQMQKTIAYMVSQNIPISAPGSLLKTAQWLKARGSVPTKKVPVDQQMDRWDVAAQSLKAEMAQSDCSNIYALFGSQNSEVYDL